MTNHCEDCRLTVHQWSVRILASQMSPRPIIFSLQCDLQVVLVEFGGQNHPVITTYEYHQIQEIKSNHCLCRLFRVFSSVSLLTI